MKLLCSVLTMLCVLVPSLGFSQGGGLDPTSLLMPLEASWPTYSGDDTGQR